MYWTVHNIQEMYSQSVHKISLNINPKLPGLKKFWCWNGATVDIFDVWSVLSVYCLDGDTSVVLKYRLKPLGFDGSKLESLKVYGPQVMKEHP